MSFSDLMSSGRGPGVIGMLLALVVLIGFGLLFLFAFDEGMQGGDQSIESVIAHQGKDIEGFNEYITQSNKKLATAPALMAASRELSSIKRQATSATERIATLGESINQGKADISARTKDFEDYKNRYRAFARDKSKGETMAVLETRTGTIYKNVSIREVTPIGIQIRHDEGQKRIPFEELSDAMIDYYQFDPSQKNDALVREAEVRNAHEGEAAAANEAAEQAMVQQRAKDAEEKTQKTLREIATKKGQISSLKDEIRGLEAERDRADAQAADARAAGRMHINKGNSIGANIRAKQNKISAIQAEISQLQASVQR